MLGNVPRGSVIAKLESSVEEDDEFREFSGGAEGIPLPSQAVVTTQFRGMDTALSKLMSDLRSLKQPTYRMFRKKMQIFEKACQARGQLVATEAALMMLNPLEGDTWLAMEDVSLDRFDTMKAFDEFQKVFDRDYQYDPEQELPARMEVLVTGFHRQRAEQLRFYVRRLDALVVKLRELKIEWPEPFLGWILLLFGHTRLADSKCEVEYGQGVLPHCCPRCSVSHVWTRFQAQFP